MKTLQRPLFLLFLILFIGKTNSQTVDPKLAEALQHTLDSMHQLLNIKGLGAALQLPNNAVWAGGSGNSTFFPPDQIGPGHAFEMGSTSKTVTAACILQLADEGVLSLADSLHSWLPDFQHINPDITIRQLLRHQSGVYDVLQNQNFNIAMSQNINKIWAFEDVVSNFIKAPVFQPGASWGYSNTNYILLGIIIETATGNSYHQELKGRFFTPMGLDSYSNPAYDPLPVPTAHLWLDITGDGVLDDANSFLASRKSLFSSIAPAGGYYAKPGDLAKWIRASMSGSLFTDETWTEATTTVSSSLPGNTKYGLGLTTRDYIGYTGFGHGGDLAGYTAQAFYFPEKDVSIVVSGNDATINSWLLTNTVSALLKTYIECENFVSAVNEADFSNISVSAFPNPFSDKINIAIELPEENGEIIFTINDLVGRELWYSAPQKITQNQPYNFTINDLAKFPSGLYLLKISIEGKLLKTIKLIK